MFAFSFIPGWHYCNATMNEKFSRKLVHCCVMYVTEQVFIRFFKGCGGGALGCERHFPFYV